jgi:hypothetical protein
MQVGYEQPATMSTSHMPPPPVPHDDSDDDAEDQEDDEDAEENQGDGEVEAPGGGATKGALGSADAYESSAAAVHCNPSTNRNQQASRSKNG